jgi:hypothetical protein
MPSIVWVRTVLKNACAVGHANAGALPCSSDDDFVLLCRSEAAERLAVGLGAMCVELRDAAPIKILLVGVGTRQREVDVVQYASIGRARLAGRAGHQAAR